MSSQDAKPQGGNEVMSALWPSGPGMTWSLVARDKERERWRSAFLPPERGYPSSRAAWAR